MTVYKVAHTFLACGALMTVNGSDALETAAIAQTEADRLTRWYADWRQRHPDVAGPVPSRFEVVAVEVDD